MIFLPVFVVVFTLTLIVVACINLSLLETYPLCLRNIGIYVAGGWISLILAIAFYVLYDPVANPQGFWNLGGIYIVTIALFILLGLVGLALFGKTISVAETGKPIKPQPNLNPQVEGFSLTRKLVIFSTSTLVGSPLVFACFEPFVECLLVSTSTRGCNCVFW